MTANHRNRLRCPFAIGLALLAATMLMGCAPHHYQVGARSLYPPDVRTISLSMFESDSFRRNLGERLTEAVAKEIEKRSTMKVVNGPHADSTLSGRITSDTKRVLVENRNDEAREVETNLQVQITWVDRQGNSLTEPQLIPLPAEVADVGAAASFVPEVGQSITTAQQQAIDRLAARIVSLLETPW